MEESCKCRSLPWTNHDLTDSQATEFSGHGKGRKKPNPQCGRSPFRTVQKPYDSIPKRKYQQAIVSAMVSKWCEMDFVQYQSKKITSTGFIGLRRQAGSASSPSTSSPSWRRREVSVQTGGGAKIDGKPQNGFKPLWKGGLKPVVWCCDFSTHAQIGGTPETGLRCPFGFPSKRPCYNSTVLVTRQPLDLPPPPPPRELRYLLSPLCSRQGANQHIPQTTEWHRQTCGRQASFWQKVLVHFHLCGGVTP